MLHELAKQYATIDLEALPSQRLFPAFGALGELPQPKLYEMFENLLAESFVRFSLFVD